MYLNRGKVYGDERYIVPPLLVCSRKAHFLDNNNRRELTGFDKPEPIKGGPTCREVSLSSFGHTGFTRTIVIG